MKRTVRTGSRCILLLSLLTFVGHAALAQGPDPGVPGPLAVTTAEYDYGDEAFTFEGRPTELRARVHYPTDLSGGPLPIVVFLHGWHPTCSQGASAFLQWPCTAPRIPIPNYQGYDYVGQVLASHGYIVVSVSANGVNARDTQFFDVGMLWRAQLIQRHLDQWQIFNTAGAAPFGGTFIGKVDLNRVGTMGHSRGGEGVSRHYTYNREQGSPYGVRAVLPLAPVNFSRPLVDNTALQVVLPYCDGDVADLQGAHYFDDARYIPGDPTNKHVILVGGGNHAFYNTIWTPGGWPAATWDDWFAFEDPQGLDPFCGAVPGNFRLTPEQQRGTGRAYFNAFFRTYLGGETAFLPLLKGDVPPPPSAQTNIIVTSYHAKDVPGSRLDVNRLLTEENLFTNTLGGAVAQLALTPWGLCGGEAPQPRFCLPEQPNKRQPHTTPSARAPERRGLSQLQVGWNNFPSGFQNDIPAAAGDVSGYAVFQFRVSVNFTDPRNPPGQFQDFSVTLIDAAGNLVSRPVSATSIALYYPPGQVGAVPKVLLNTVRIPLSSFVGIDLRNVRAVQFRFDQQTQGAVLISDIAFAD